MESATLFRKAAGVYSYLAERVLHPLKLSLPKESPVEATSSLSSIMKLVCLADAQVNFFFTSPAELLIEKISGEHW